MTELDLLSAIRDGASRLASLSEADRARALADLRASAARVATTFGFTEKDGCRLAEELVSVLLASLPDAPADRVLH